MVNFRALRRRIGETIEDIGDKIVESIPDQGLLSRLDPRSYDLDLQWQSLFDCTNLQNTPVCQNFGYPYSTPLSFKFSFSNTECVKSIDFNAALLASVGINLQLSYTNPLCPVFSEEPKTVPPPEDNSGQPPNEQETPTGEATPTITTPPFDFQPDTNNYSPEELECKSICEAKFDVYLNLARYITRLKRAQKDTEDSRRNLERNLKRIFEVVNSPTNHQSYCTPILERLREAHDRNTLGEYLFPTVWVQLQEAEEPQITESETLHYLRGGDSNPLAVWDENWKYQFSENSYIPISGCGCLARSRTKTVQQELETYGTTPCSIIGGDWPPNGILLTPAHLSLRFYSQSIVHDLFFIGEDGNANFIKSAGYPGLPLPFNPPLPDCKEPCDCFQTNELIEEVRRIIAVINESLR